MLVTFFLLGTSATKVKHDVKATLTLSSSGSSGGEGPRTSVQVLANSLAASLLVLRHLWVYGLSTTQETLCFGGAEGTRHADLLLMGIMANYAAVTADTLSSELGILAKGRPVLITTLKPVPPGTNGGVSGAGLLAGIAGAAAIAVNCCLLLDVCAAAQGGEVWLLAKVFVLLTGLGTVGTLLDSLLGAVLQASVVDRRSGKIVEGAGGVKVLTRSSRGASQSSADGGSTGKGKLDPHESRVISSGRDILDNNQINLLMASIVSGLGVLVGTLL